MLRQRDTQVVDYCSEVQNSTFSVAHWSSLVEFGITGHPYGLGGPILQGCNHSSKVGGTFDTGDVERETLEVSRRDRQWAYLD